VGGLEEERREGLKGVDTGASVGEELRGEGNDGRGMGASRWWRRDRSPRLASSSNIEGELIGVIPCKDGEAGYHPAGEMLHRLPMFINEMIKFGLKQIELD